IATSVLSSLCFQPSRDLRDLPSFPTRRSSDLANPALISIAQEPLDFRRKCLSHFLSLLMSSFALPIPPGALTSLPSQAYGTLRYRLRQSRKPKLRCIVLDPVHLRRRIA